MRVGLFDFQKDALSDLQVNISEARVAASIDRPRAISFSAPTGAGKTVVMTALFENIFFGDAEFSAQPDAVILWLSDMPELNEQTRLKIEEKSDRIRTGQLVTIDNSFDSEIFAGGNIYFMNTQKLGSDKLLTVKGDNRQFPIWQTLTNTAKAIPDRFYVVIDEAHRGMRGRGAAEAQTIMQKFILGSPADGLSRMPLVIGMSATPRRFDDLIAGAPHTVYKVPVDRESVRVSGLLKDRVLIDFPRAGAQAEMTLLAEAANTWKDVEKKWTAYCTKEDEPIVSPILVIQVEDATADKNPSRTDLSSIVATIERALGRQLRVGEIAHTFNDAGDFEVAGRRIRRVEASRIQDDSSIRVVLFKMSLSTGWDCPRAEVMMSFRGAQDHTYIAQLLGRMVRSPLARRIASDASLNDVHLYLPHFDKTAVEAIINDLKIDEDVPPTEVGSSKELVALNRRPGLDHIFAAFEKLPTYRVDAVRKQSSLRRLMALSGGLTRDGVDVELLNQTKGGILSKMQSEIARLRESGELASHAERFTGVEIERIALEYGTDASNKANGYIVDAASADIDRHFAQAGRTFGNGLHIEYWKSQGDREAHDVKVETLVLANNSVGIDEIEKFAEDQFDEMYANFRPAIARSKEQRKNAYERLRLAAKDPKDIPWRLPEVIDFKRSLGASEYAKHLFVEGDGKFRADLGPWEREVVQMELLRSDVVGWLRNEPRKSWSLEIPYEIAGVWKPMFPDLVVVREISGGYQFDILEPHDPSRSDNILKAIGLAKFAGKHGLNFGRIQLIRKRGTTGNYVRLDFSDNSIRRSATGLTTNAQLDALFETNGKT
ncbi:MAG: DEAD/DEAH box helicase family protein [Pyrinomonadaceae bacterium]